MKKLLITTLLLLTLALTACSTSASPTTAAPAGTLPMATQLIIGTMKLDGTEQDVTAEQAAELIPLWQVYSELTTSDMAAQEEVDGLISQIQETMTDGQMQAITDMNLTQQDVMAVMQEQGLGMGGGGQNLSAEQIATAQALRESTGGGGFAGGPPDGGGMPAGGPPDGGGGMPMDGGMPFGNQSTSGDDGTTTGAGRGPMGGGVPSALIDALIELLKSKAGS